MDQQDFLIFQQIQHKFLIVCDTELPDVQLREDIKGRFRFHRSDSRNIRQCLINILPLFIDPSAGSNVIPDALMPSQCRLYDRLRRYIGAESHIGKHLDSLDIIGSDPFVSAENHPSDPESRDHMRFGQSAVGHAEQIRRKRRDGYMFFPIHDQAVINLIGKNHQLMFSCNVNDLLKHFPWIQRSRRIVRVDDNDRFRPGSDLLSDIRHIRIPVGLFITDIMNGFASCKGRTCRPERIIRGRDQDLIAVVQKRRHAEIDQFADTVSCIDIIHRYIRDVFQLRILHDRLSRRKKPIRRRIALASGQLLLHIMNYLIRRMKIERRRISDVQLQNADTCLFHTFRFLNHRSPDIVQHMIQLRGFSKNTNIVLSLHASIFQIRALGSRFFQAAVFCHRLLSHQPIRFHLKRCRQKVQNLCPRHRFPAYILADMAFAKLHSLFLRCPDQIHLLHLMLFHCSSQSLRKYFI